MFVNWHTRDACVCDCSSAEASLEHPNDCPVRARQQTTRTCGAVGWKNRSWAGLPANSWFWGPWLYSFRMSSGDFLAASERIDAPAPMDPAEAGRPATHVS